MKGDRIAEMHIFQEIVQMVIQKKKIKLEVSTQQMNLVFFSKDGVILNLVHALQKPELDQKKFIKGEKNQWVHWVSMHKILKAAPISPKERIGWAKHLIENGIEI